MELKYINLVQHIFDFILRTTVVTEIISHNTSSARCLELWANRSTDVRGVDTVHIMVSVFLE